MDEEEFNQSTQDRKYRSPVTQFIHENVAEHQRGNPEKAMVLVQQFFGGGVLNYIVEHVGDLTHRMSESPTSSTAGFEYVENKVNKTLRILESKYRSGELPEGFVNEMNENIINNVRYRNPEITEKDLIQAIEKFNEDLKHKLLNYANEHRQIPVFNQVQRWARDAAVAVGEQNWLGAIDNLHKLKEVLDQGIEAWMQEAHKIDKNLLNEWAKSKGHV